MNAKHRVLLLVVLIPLLVFSGCKWFKPNPTPTPGEGESEGEMVLEGEQPREGEIAREGEAVVEGEAGQTVFTSADMGGSYRDDETDGIEPPTNEEEGEATGDGERELVEPDVIRRNGNLLYVLNQYRGLSIVDLEKEQLLSQTPTQGYPRDLYLVGNRAYVLVSYAQDIRYADGLLSISYGSKLYVFDVSDPARVLEAGAFSFTGDLVDSRLVGGILYAVCSDYTGYECCAGEDGTVAPEAASKSYGNTWAISVSVADPTAIAIVDQEVFSGYGNLIQATNEAIFSVSMDYSANNYQSLITYVDISDAAGDIVIRGTASAPGYMADRFKMDAWNGVLRVVTNTWWPSRETVISTFDLTQPDTLSLLGSTTLKSASGETTYATRFAGDRAYIVTYLTVDPLFVVDLSDPTLPEVVGELKIPGWSTHIEPRGDRLIALGVDDAEGQRRVMVSLFDVSDPADPERLDYVSFGENWSWSQAYNDVKAFTVMDDLVLVPFGGWNHASGGYDRLQFVSWTESDLELQGHVDLQGSAVRSFAYETLYYAVTQEQLAIINADDLSAPQVVRSIVLAENIVDVAPLANGALVQAVARNDSGDILLRTQAAESGDAAGEIAIEEAWFSDLAVWGNQVVLTTTYYEEQGGYAGVYHVYLVDFSDPAAPTLTAKWALDIQPWWGGCYDCYYPEVDVAAKRVAGPWHYYGGYYSTTNVLLAGDYLAVRGYREKYDQVFGPDAPAQGLALINLAETEDVVYVGLGYAELTDLRAEKDLLYITTKKSLGADEQQRWVCAYYLHQLNPATLTMGPDINVPGIFMHQLPGSSRLIFQDMQYSDAWQTDTILRSVLLENDVATLVDSRHLPMGYWTVMGDASHVYYCGYRYGQEETPGPGEGNDGGAPRPEPAEKVYYGPTYLVGNHGVTRSGTFTDGDVFDLGQHWSNLLAVKNQRAYLSIAGAAIGRVSFSETPPALDQLVPIMGYPSRIRFDETHAYAPLGYSGLAVFDQ